MIVFPFQRNLTTQFTFSPMLDGQKYLATVSWNIFGLRYYVNLFDQSGVLIFSLPMIGSTDTFDISITAGYFNTTMIFRTSQNRFEIG